MLTNPENYEEWEDFVWAVDQNEAWKKCQGIADEAPLTEVINVTQETKRRSKRGTYKFVCWFRSEVNPNDDRND
jgi:hypothetical protein